ncbi:MULTISPECIES: DUF423 domain-containing protein [unclassified Marinobacterium]|nr:MULTISPECIES: DUF423 domain-containing protein [unclassified Marinobacterium]NRP46665.1 hypothetical protein [Marinobacterium sp. xm-d-543]NRQ02075.1 hypothetical protein [Marinobacterium sp. xm-d-530]NRP14875.1 hypothetical protein [Marinobacterium sp. xm-a-152]NRP27383.1 hypothetical protein [Marinobacterium sp. xm-d-420]NRP38605.1 hypothetical protein [Marinobacterium sp. xm-a-121]
MHAKRFLMIGALLAMFSVIFGAFGAHLLKSTLSAARFETFSTAVDYQFWQALGLMVVGITGFKLNSKSWRLAGYSLLAGTLIFSGSLYLLIATDTGWLGAITPIGGILMIIGWALFAWSLRTLRIEQ